MQKFYVIEKKYVGPNQDQHIDDDCIIISTRPAVFNWTGDVCVAGWCGTTDDWATFALGAYDNMHAADAAVRALGPMRDTDPGTGEAYVYPYDDENEILARYKRGLLTPMSKDQSIEWAYDTIRGRITAVSTDAEMDAVCEWLAGEADYQKYRVDMESIKIHMAEYRAQLRDEQEQ